MRAKMREKSPFSSCRDFTRLLNFTEQFLVLPVQKALVIRLRSRTWTQLLLLLHTWRDNRNPREMEAFVHGSFAFGLEWSFFNNFISDRKTRAALKVERASLDINFIPLLCLPLSVERMEKSLLSRQTFWQKRTQERGNKTYIHSHSLLQLPLEKTSPRVHRFEKRKNHF